MSLLRKVLCLLSLAVAATSQVLHVHDKTFIPDASLHVTRKNISIGGIRRYTTMINGSIPGPPLRFTENQVAWVRVHNDMADDNLTMHWHGISQAAYPFSDGTPLASQWPIPPHHFFDYELSFPNGSAGTYFYHSHVGFQASTASGALIVDDAKPSPYPVDGERIIHLAELFSVDDKSAAEGLEATPFVWTGDSIGWIINGKTIANHGATMPASQSLSVIDVEPDKTYRFRFIGGASLSYSSMAFENHTHLQVIEADGAYTKPYNTSLLQIGAGQRFSTLFRSKSCRDLAELGKKDYYFQIESRDRPTVTTNYAVLRYGKGCNSTGTQFAPPISTNANPTSPPLELPPTINGFLDYKLQSLHPSPDFPASSEVNRRVILKVQQIANRSYVWQDDGVVWTDDASDPLPHTTPGEPYLVALYRNQTQYLPDYSAAVANGGLDPSTKTFPARIGEVIEIVFQQYGAHGYDGSAGGGLDTHPWHGHGLHYWDLGGGPGQYDPSVVEEHWKGGRTPVMRDTTMLYRYNATVRPDEAMGWRAWRLRIEDAGVWMVHCHLLQHMIMGMQTVWVHGDAKDILKLPKPQVRGYLKYGGDVYGNSTHAPRVLHFSEAGGAKTQ